jgi:hypothetical protein
MKLLGAVFVAFLATGSLCAQYKSVGGWGNVAFPALGHAPTGGNPWGNVAFPAIPQGSAAFTPAARGTGNHYGGLVNGFGAYGSTSHGNRRSHSSGIYAYPVFVGGFGYGPGYGNGPDQSAPPSDAASPNPAAPPPVVINQYFGQAQPDQGPPQDASSGSNFHFYQAPANSEAPPSADTTYYLIAFKDHTIYSAVAYYTEGDTLHYFTSGNVHNQVSLSLVDRQLTDQLNRERNVQVRLP